VATQQCHYAFYNQQKIRVMGICPGWVKTDMGGPDATREILEGIEGILWTTNTPASVPSGNFSAMV